MRKKLFYFIQAAVSLLCVPFYFLRVFHDEGILPGQDAQGNFVPVRRTYDYSMLENLTAQGAGWLFYASLALTVLSAAFALACIFLKENKRRRVADIAVFILSLLVFAAAVLIAAATSRGY